jgi:hypothetical protein
MIKVSQVDCDKLIPDTFDFKKLVPESFTNSSSLLAEKEIKDSETFLYYRRRHHHHHGHHHHGHHHRRHHHHRHNWY